jgi:hypothetical protein
MWNAKMLMNTKASSPCKQKMPVDYESRFPQVTVASSPEEKKNGARESQLYYSQSCQSELKCSADLFAGMK